MQKAPTSLDVEHEEAAVNRMCLDRSSQPLTVLWHSAALYTLRWLRGEGPEAPRKFIGSASPWPWNLKLAHAVDVDLKPENGESHVPTVPDLSRCANDRQRVLLLLQANRPVDLSAGEISELARLPLKSTREHLRQLRLTG